MYIKKNEQSKIGCHCWGTNPASVSGLLVSAWSGCRWVRATRPMQMDVVAEGPGRYNFRDNGEASIDFALSNGMSVMGILDGRWGNETRINKLPWASPIWEKLDLWEDFVRAAVNYYKDRVKYWEILNEPPFFWWYPTEPGIMMPEVNPQIQRAPIWCYADFLKASARAIRDIDPDAQIVVGSGFADGSFLRKLYELGCKDDFDIASVHYLNCRHPEEYARGYRNLRNIMAEYGDEHKPLWDTESGPNGAIIGVEDSGAGEGRSVYNIYRHCLAYECGLDRYFWFNPVQREGEAAGHQIPLFSDDGSPGLDYKVMRALYDRVGEHGLIESAHIEREVHVYVFESSEEPVSVLWSTAPAMVHFARNPDGAVDYLGRPIALHREAELSGKPVYIPGNVLASGINATVHGARKTVALSEKGPEPCAPISEIPYLAGVRDADDCRWKDVPYLGKGCVSPNEADHFCLLPSNVPADVQAVWDDEALVLRVRTYDGPDAKTGFVQFTLRDDSPSVPEWPYFYNGYGLFTLYASERGAMLLRYAHMFFDEYPYGAVKDAEVEAKPWEGGLMYFARVPWSEIGPCRPGANEPFTLMFTFNRADNLLDVPNDEPEEWPHNFEDNFIVKKTALAVRVRFKR